MKYKTTYNIEGGLQHTWFTKNKIKTANENGEIVFTKKQKQQQKCILEMMRLLIHETKKLNIKIFAISGTLLGAKRNGGLIPYDDDGDFGFEMCDFNKLMKLTKLDIHPDYKLVHCNGDIGFRMISKGPFIAQLDLFAFGQDKDPSKVVHISPIIDGVPTYYTQYLFPRDWMDASCIKKLEWVDFEDFKMPIPSDSVNQLKHIYGDDCMTTYVADSRAISGVNMHDYTMPLHTILCKVNKDLYKITSLMQYNNSPNREKHLYFCLGKIATILLNANFEDANKDIITQVAYVISKYIQK